MAEEPTVLVLHTVAATAWGDVEALRTEIEKRVPVDVLAAHTPPESRDLVGDAEVILAAFLPSELLAAAESLEWVQALSAGVDFFDHETLADRGVVLTSAAGVHAEPVAEQVWGYILAFERQLHVGMAQQERRTWERYEGGEVRGKTLGIVGLGAIGGRVAEYGRAFDMTVLATRRDPSRTHEAVDEVYGPDGLYEVLPRADYLVISCPLTDETRGLLGPPEIGALSDDAVLINVARGAVVREDALVNALQQAELGGAALDVFETEPLPADSPLWDLSSVIVTPHMAGSTPHKEARIAEVFATNYEAYAGGGDFVNRRI